MRLIFLFLFACAAFASLGSAAKVAERPRLTYTGLGDVKIGMSETRVKALGFKLTQTGPWDKIGGEYYNDCHHLDSAPNYPNVAVMISQQKVVRIEIDYNAPSGLWKSYSGATNGMTDDEVLKIYGKKVKRKPHPYSGDAGSYLTLTKQDGRYSMIFETGLVDGKQPKRVQGFRSGYSLPVGYIEGCA